MISSISYLSIHGLHKDWDLNSDLVWAWQFLSALCCRFVRATYGVASAYVLADTADKATKMSKVSILMRMTEQVLMMFVYCQEKDSDTGKVALAAFDTLVWQAFASVIVPGKHLHYDTERERAFTRAIVKHSFF